MKILRISHKELSEFAAFCRKNNLNIGINATQDAKDLITFLKVSDIEKTIYYLQFLFVSNKNDIEKYYKIASQFFNISYLLNKKNTLDYRNLLEETQKLGGKIDRKLESYLLSSDDKDLEKLSFEAISSYESLDFSRPVSINYWVERIMESKYVEELMTFFDIIKTNTLDDLYRYELKQEFIENFRREVFTQLFNTKNDSKEEYDSEFLNFKEDINEKDFLHTNKVERQQLIYESQKLGKLLAVKMKKQYKNKKNGKLSLRKTIRKSLSSGGSMFSSVHLSKVRRKPKLVVFCDISGSMALYSIFGLNFLSGILKTFRNIKAYVFIDGTTDVTELVRNNVGDEISQILGKWNNFVKADGHSDYSVAFETLLNQINKISSNNLHLLVIGDARNNYRNIDKDVLSILSEKFSKIYWLNPEKRKYWSTGDSIISQIEPLCDSLEEVRNLSQLKLFVEKISKKII